MGDGDKQWEQDPFDVLGEASLKSWRVRLLNGILITGAGALLPGVLVQAWQWRGDPYNAQSGMLLSAVGLAALTALARWRAPYRLRAGLLIGMCAALMPPAMLTQGFNPSYFVCVCSLTTIGVLLYSGRVAYAILATSAAFMAMSAYLFAKGYVAPIPRSMLDEREPLNWLRIGMFTFFPSALAAVATSIFLGKLRDTLKTRGELVLQLRAEVNQRERALADLEHAQARLLHAQKLEAIGQLAAGIAHDFNNTLAVVTLEAEVLKRCKLEPAPVSRAAEALLGAAERGKHLTQQLLLFNRSEHGPRPVIDCTREFGEYVHALRRLLPSEIAFELDIAGEPLNVRIAPAELQQIVLNLGINARDAMPQGGKLRMSLTRTELSSESAASLSVSPGSYALLCCSDDGSGMDAETRARVFEPFFTTKAPGRGSGLGLTNVWNISRRAGGAVHAESQPACGARLFVHLPISSAPADGVEVPAARDEPLRGHETVLVVEDDICVRALLVSLLADAGYNALDASSVDHALSLAREYRDTIDLVCTDVVMPGRPARDLIGELRADRPEIGVLICSGYSEDEQIARGIGSGEFKHLPKPFTRQALLCAVRDALRARLTRSAFRV